MQTVEVVKALRCISAPNADERYCENCSFCVKEVLDAEYTAIFEGDEVDACDCDAVGNLAADRLEELLNRCARYAEKIAMLQERQRWIPVTERLPKDEKPVLTFVGYADTMHGFITVSTYFALDPSPHWQWDGLVADRAQKTLYWMPLPPAPEVTCDG